ncbi:MAG: 3-oxoacyl-[acyl-carrier-protein] synthase III C-terminal domain-containing protein [Gemmatimonadaceae bacterium]
MSGTTGTSCAPGITGVAYAFPALSHSVRELGELGLLRSPSDTLESFGFGHVHVATSESPYDLALCAARRLMQEHDIPPGSVDLLIYGGLSGRAAFDVASTPPQAPMPMSRYSYPATRLQFDLGLANAMVWALDQQACTTLFAAVRVARAMCTTEGMTRVLCVCSEFTAADGSREAIFNCVSDAACAVLVDGDAARNRLRGAAHITKGYYWDADALRDEIIASYFPTARHAVHCALHNAGWLPEDVTWVIPHNVSLRSWQILLGLLGLPNARLWSRNIARDGHTLAGDNFINLCDAMREGAIQPGDRLLLFSYGYGAHWTALALEA